MTGIVISKDLRKELWYGADTTDDGDVVIETGGVHNFAEFMFSSLTGSMWVYVFNGRDWLPDPIHVQDMSVASGTRYRRWTTAGAQYKVFGSFVRMRLVQRGSTPVTGATLLATRIPTG